MVKPIPKSFIFMKVGSHAGETFEEILERKSREVKVAGCSFWGYGGTTLHPVHHVQPFARLQIKEHGSIYLMMQPMNSHAVPTIVPASEYSVDGIRWEKIPDGIRVTGSRYALVLDEILPDALELSLNAYEVGIGRSSGRIAEEYIRGRVDKGCLVKREESTINQPPAKRTVAIGYTAHLAEPYGVLLR